MWYMWVWISDEDEVAGWNIDFHLYPAHREVWCHWTDLFSMCIAPCILEAMFYTVFHQIRIMSSHRSACKAFKAEMEMVKTEQKKNHGTHRWWSDSTTMVSASRSCHPSNIFNLSSVWVNKGIATQPTETLQLKDLHHIEGALPQRWPTTKVISWTSQIHIE